MSHHWNESEVTIEHPGMQNLKRGQTTEYTGNILYETEGDRFQEAIETIMNTIDREVTLGRNVARLPFNEQWEILKKTFNGIQLKGEGLEQIVDEYMKGELTIAEFSSDIEELSDMFKSKEASETIDGDEALRRTNPPHTNYEQVRGAAEVFNLISSDPVTDNEISYEQRREYALEQMRKNCVYQFCMLLAGFTNVNMNKYWVTPSETTMGIDRSASNTVVTKENTKVKARIIYYLPANQPFQTPTMLEEQRFVRTEDGFLVNYYKSNTEMDPQLRFVRVHRCEYMDANSSERANRLMGEFNLGAVDTIDWKGEQKRWADAKIDINVPFLASKERTTSTTTAGGNPTNARTETTGAFHRWYINTSWADGKLHLSPMVYAHLEEAHNMVRFKWAHLKEVALDFFIESEDIRSYFARLVAYNIRTSDVLSGQRYHLNSTYPRINHEKAKLLNVFRHVRYDGGTLSYHRHDSPGEYVRGTTYAERYMDTLAVADARKGSMVFGPSYEQMGRWDNAVLSRYFSSMGDRYTKRLKTAYPNL